jgi:hypothetical protein
VNVYIDAALTDATQNANDLINDADRVVQQNDDIFGTTGSTVNVIIWALNGQTDGTGGADHASCDYNTGANIEVCASFSNSMRVSALFEAELSECSMGGNLCGENTGEALSRWCASAVSNNALSDFVTAPTWVQDGMQDYVDTTDPTDQNPDSTGCGMAFISWLMSQGYGLNVIAPSMVALGDAGTFAQLYAKLSGDDPGNAWPNFQTAIQNLPSGVTNDDPFAAGPQLGAIHRVEIWMPELAGKIFSDILAHIAKGHSEKEIVRSVGAILAAAPPRKSKGAYASCVSKSHRLMPAAKARKNIPQPQHN